MNLDAQNSTGVAEYDNDGNQVLGIDKIETYTNNIYGQRLTSFADNNADGKDDYKEYYTLNTYGGWVKKEIDLTGNGTVDKTEVYTKDVNDNHLENIYYVGDVATSREVYQIDAYGRTMKTSRDYSNDNTIENTTSYERDEWGRVVKEYYDSNNSGEADRVVTYTHNEYGQIIKTETDFGNDGTVDAVITYQRNALGQNVLEERDTNNDGIIDIRYENTFDEYGRTIASKIYNYNSVSGEYVLATENTFSYNEYGQRTYNETYNSATGITSWTRYYYNEFGQTIRQEHSNNTSMEFSYNERGQIETRLDYDSEGNLTLKSVYPEYDYSFNPNGVQKIIESYDGNDRLTSVNEFIRDATGNIIHTLTDYPGNGIGEPDRYKFGNRAAATGGLNVTEDITTWSDEQLAKLGSNISIIDLAHDSVSTLTLNAEVVAKISNGGLRIIGGNDNNDIVYLSGFEKSATSSRSGYDQYTADFDGEHLNVFVSNTVETHVIG